MRLFFALFKKKMPKGHIYRGKDKLIKPVAPEDIAKLRLQFEIEEKNMFYLRHSYLTVEQSSGHAKALGKPEENFNKTIGQRKKEFFDNVTLESRLGHLRYREAWD